MDKFVEEIEDDEFDHTLQAERHEALIEALGNLASAVKENRANEIQSILKQNQANLEKLFLMIPKVEKNDDVKNLGNEIKSSLETLKKELLSELKRKKQFSFSIERKNLLITGGTITEQ